MDPLLESILAELRPRLPEWYPDADPTAPIDVLDDDARAIARVIRLGIARIAAPPQAIIVKAGVLEPTRTDRPRLVETAEPADRHRLEFEALRMLEARLATVPDERLVAVRPLGLLPESGALAMEAFAGRPLQRLLVRGALGRASDVRPTTLAETAGRWLRVLHDTPPTGQVARQGTRDELAAAFSAVGAYLAERRGTRRLEPVIEAGIGALARLPDPIPMVISHGDFAPRNILVDASGRLAVIDLLARWLAPPYEDIAGFLVALQTSRANAATRGVVFGRAIARLEPAFLTGYFGSRPVPRTAIRVFELLLLLDRWSARESRGDSSGRLGRLRERLIDGHYDARSRVLARDLRAGR